jgi:hypothetical protein
VTFPSLPPSCPGCTGRGFLCAFFFRLPIPRRRDYATNAIVDLRDNSPTNK